MLLFRMRVGQLSCKKQRSKLLRRNCRTGVVRQHRNHSIPSQLPETLINRQLPYSSTIDITTTTVRRGQKQVDELACNNANHHAHPAAMSDTTTFDGRTSVLGYSGLLGRPSDEFSESSQAPPHHLSSGSSTLVTSAPTPTHSRMLKRLFTHIDPVRAHAITASLMILFTSFETLRSLYHVACLHQLPNVEHQLLLPAVLLLNMIKDCTGLQLTLKHRKGILKAAFATVCLMSFDMALLAYYYHPSFPANLHVAAEVVVAMSLPAILYWGGYRLLMDYGSIVKTRDDKKLQQHSSMEVSVASRWLRWQASMQYVINGAAYMVPFLLPNWILLCTSSRVLFGGWDLREFDLAQSPPLGDLGVIDCYVGLLGGNLGTFAVTLRDRNLISRSTELGIMGWPFVAFFIICGGSLPVVGWDDWWYATRAVVLPTLPMLG